MARFQITVPVDTDSFSLDNQDTSGIGGRSPLATPSQQEAQATRPAPSSPFARNDPSFGYSPSTYLPSTGLPGVDQAQSLGLGVPSQTSDWKGVPYRIPDGQQTPSNRFGLPSNIGLSEGLKTALEQSWQNVPQRSQYQPSVWRRIAATIGGAGAGFQGGAAAGMQAAQGLLDQPYMQAYQDWAAKNEAIQKAAQIEAGDIRGYGSLYGAMGKLDPGLQGEIEEARKEADAKAKYRVYEQELEKETPGATPIPYLDFLQLNKSGIQRISPGAAVSATSAQRNIQQGGQPYLGLDGQPIDTSKMAVNEALVAVTGQGGVRWVKVDQRTMKITQDNWTRTSPALNPEIATTVGQAITPTTREQPGFNIVTGQPEAQRLTTGRVTGPQPVVTPPGTIQGQQPRQPNLQQPNLQQPQETPQQQYQRQQLEIDPTSTPIQGDIPKVINKDTVAETMRRSPGVPRDSIIASMVENGFDNQMPKLSPQQVAKMEQAPAPSPFQPTPTTTPTQQPRQTSQFNPNVVNEAAMKRFGTIYSPMKVSMGQLVGDPKFSDAENLGEDEFAELADNPKSREAIGAVLDMIRNKTTEAQGTDSVNLGGGVGTGGIAGILGLGLHGFGGMHGNIHIPQAFKALENLTGTTYWMSKEHAAALNDAMDKLSPLEARYVNQYLSSIPATGGIRKAAGQPNQKWSFDTVVTELPGIGVGDTRDSQSYYRKWASLVRSGIDAIKGQNLPQALVGADIARWTALAQDADKKAKNQPVIPPPGTQRIQVQPGAERTPLEQAFPKNLTAPTGGINVNRPDIDYTVEKVTTPKREPVPQKK